MAEAVCLQCGYEKKLPWMVCRKCEFDPRTDTDSLVKSVYLSTGRFDDAEMKSAYSGTLNEISSLIRTGTAINFDQSDLIRLNRQRSQIVEIPWFAPWLAVVRLFWLPAVFIASMLILARVIRFLKGI